MERPVDAGDHRPDRAALEVLRCGADQRPDLRQLPVPGRQGGVEVIAIGNPPLLLLSKRAAVRADFPPLRTVRATFTAHGAPSMQINCCMYVNESVFPVNLRFSSALLHQIG